LREAQFSALSALAWRKYSVIQYQVAVYTDHPEYFDRFPLDLHHVTAEQYETWAGPEKFTYRIKFFVLQDALRRYGAPCVLFDSDTFVKASLDSLLRRFQPGVTIMDRPDGFVFRDERFAEFAERFRKCFPDLRVSLDDSDCLTISECDTVMQIAGVVGIHHADAELVGLALRALDAMLPRMDYFTMEQFAFSVVLGQRTRVIPSADCIEHYWGSWVDPYFGVSKIEFYRRQIDDLLGKFEMLPFDEGLDLIHRTRIRPYTRPIVYRIFNRVRGMIGKGVS
jgi:hypothetical protein